MGRSKRRPRTALGRALRAIHHAIFTPSRAGRAAEVVAWSNAISALAIGAGVGYALHAHGSTSFVWIGLVVAASAFALLRLALVHRVTVWVAAVPGTLVVAALGGGLAWVFAHVLESMPLAPSIAGVVGALASAALPAWSYGEVARRRADEVPDSLLDPVSLPPSR